MPLEKPVKFLESKTAPVSRLISSIRCCRPEKVGSRKYIDTRCSCLLPMLKSKPASVAEYQQAVIRSNVAPGSCNADGLVEPRSQIHCGVEVLRAAYGGNDDGAPTIQKPSLPYTPFQLPRVAMSDCTNLASASDQMTKLDGLL